jgi:hypothetical protein
MRSKLMRGLIMSGVAAAAAMCVGNAMATPANSGFTGTTLVKGTFGDIEVFNHLVAQNVGGSRRGRDEGSRLGRDDGSGPGRDDGSPQGRDVWFSLQKTKGDSDLYVQSNTWEPGGSTGWHTHPGHSLIILTAGTVTEYDGDDPSCTPKVHTAPATFVDPGGNHAHLIVNQGSVRAQGYAVQLIPKGAARRIDVPVDQVPAGCPVF